MKKPVVLTIMDGFGYTPNKEGNAIALAGTPTWMPYLPSILIP